MQGLVSFIKSFSAPAPTLKSDPLSSRPILSRLTAVTIPNLVTNVTCHIRKLFDIDAVRLGIRLWLDPDSMLGWETVGAVPIPSFRSAKPNPLSGKGSNIMLICWEANLRESVAEIARERILKAARSKILGDLANIEGTDNLMREVEPIIQKAIKEINSELQRMENAGYRVGAVEFERNIDSYVQSVLEKVWAELEPRIADVQALNRIKAWMEEMRVDLGGISAIEKRAAEVLRVSVRQILYDFNARAEDELGQTIPGDVEGTGENAMHLLGEAVVANIMDTDLPFPVALPKIVANLAKGGFVDIAGREDLVTDLLRSATTDDGNVNLEKLFSDFRREFLDPGPDTLASPKVKVHRHHHHARGDSHGHVHEHQHEEGGHHHESY